MGIYTIEQDIELTLEKYYNCFDENGELIVEQEEFEKVDKELLELQNKKSDFINWMLKKRVNDISNIDIIKTEINRLKDLQKSIEKKVEKSEKFISNIIKPLYAGKPIQYDLFRVSFRKSTQVIVDNQDKLDEKYVVEKTTYTPDKTKIKEDLKAGVEITGARLEEKQNLQIK